MAGRFVTAMAVVHVVCALSAPAAQAEAAGDQQVQRSVTAYLATGHRCPCPYNTMRDGRLCGRHSAYSRPSGLKPLCYATDDAAGEIKARARRGHAARSDGRKADQTKESDESRVQPNASTPSRFRQIPRPAALQANPFGNAPDDDFDVEPSLAPDGDQPRR